MIDLGVLPSLGTFIGGMNNRGAIAGFADQPGGSRAFVWSDGEFTDLPALNGSGFSVANDINSKGWVVGYSATPAGGAHATLWRHGVPTDLGALADGRLSVATGVNDHGQVVGWGYNAAFETRAILWAGGAVIDLGTLPGGNASLAMDINDRGVVAGISNGADVLTAGHGTLWTRRRQP
jgi:probable HAF family extracellular repeat protein